MNHIKYLHPRMLAKRKNEKKNLDLSYWWPCSKHRSTWSNFRCFGVLCLWSGKALSTHGVGWIDHGDSITCNVTFSFSFFFFLLFFLGFWHYFSGLYDGGACSDIFLINWWLLLLKASEGALFVQICKVIKWIISIEYIFFG